MDNVMTKEQLEQRIKMLEEQMTKLIADYNAIMGAKQDCEYWLAELLKANPELSPECVDKPVDNPPPAEEIPQ